ncbi:hypothetical protein DVR12_17755 [Chitinophaga silvatica]|uniref:Uncharacterized protein n=1 Tax=Chitinophaga silvatica TaxID=2282649 RepID=A0A3E1Y7Y5_9BACT|nr:hypothetical protein [Chitinophaga silvatica]RFS21179.1 hypothetical protein DVR12_17755 [Chitinophaga silvatica]
MNELDKTLGLFVDHLVARFRAELVLKSILDVNVRLEKHYEKQKVQFIIEVIALNYQAREDSYYDEYGPVLSITLNTQDKKSTIEFLIIRSHGPILYEKIVEFEEELNIELKFLETEVLLMNFLVALYLN